MTLGTDNGSAFKSRGFRHRLAEHGITHRRGGYRDLESQAFVESWFGKVKERLVWRSEFETLDQARKEIAAYIERYHHSPTLRPALPDAGRVAPDMGGWSANRQISGLK